MTSPMTEHPTDARKDGSLTLDNRSVQRLMDYGLLHYTDEGWAVGTWNDLAMEAAKPSTPNSEGLVALIEKVARAVEPDEWQRFDNHVAEFTANYPSREEQYRAFIFGGAYGYIFERSLKYARAAIAALKASLPTPAIDDEGLVERLLEAAQPFADSVNIDPSKKRGERHWATIGYQTNLDHVLALKNAIEAIRASNVS